MRACAPNASATLPDLGRLSLNVDSDALERWKVAHKEIDKQSRNAESVKRASRRISDIERREKNKQAKEQLAQARAEANAALQDLRSTPEGVKEHDEAWYNLQTHAARVKLTLGKLKKLESGEYPQEVLHEIGRLFDEAGRQNDLELMATLLPAMHTIGDLGKYEVKLPQLFEYLLSNSDIPSHEQLVKRNEALYLIDQLTLHANDGHNEKFMDALHAKWNEAKRLGVTPSGMQRLQDMKISKHVPKDKLVSQEMLLLELGEASKRVSTLDILDLLPWINTNARFRVLAQSNVIPKLWSLAFSNPADHSKRRNALQIIAKITEDATNENADTFIAYVRAIAYQKSGSPLLAALGWADDFQRNAILELATRLVDKADTETIAAHKEECAKYFGLLLDAAFHQTDVNLRRNAANVIVNAFKNAKPDAHQQQQIVERFIRLGMLGYFHPNVHLPRAETISPIPQLIGLYKLVYEAMDGNPQASSIVEAFKAFKG